MIVFRNPGEIDPRVISTMGVNVKESNSAIGYFGTGLKYAIATILREGGQITIYSGRTAYELLTRTEVIRGQEFQVIYMNTTALGFTTELGKNWTLANAYRELWSNVKDERGIIAGPEMAGNSGLLPAAGYTTIQVEGLDETHADRKEFLLETSGKPLYADGRMEVWEGENDVVFYRGIAVGKLPHPSSFTYNILTPVTLTEDRTAADIYSVMWSCIQAFFLMPEEHLLEALISPATFEHEYNYSYVTLPSNFSKFIRKHVPTHLGKFPQMLMREYFRTNKDEQAQFPVWTPEEEQRGMLADAKALLMRFGCNVTAYNFEFRKLGEVPILLRGKNIFLDRAAFESPKVLSSALLLVVAVDACQARGEHTPDSYIASKFLDLMQRLHDDHPDLDCTGLKLGHL